MTMLNGLTDRISGLLDLGGPVVALLLALSVLSLAVILWKLWQFRAMGVGRHGALGAAIDAWDTGRDLDARRAVDRDDSAIARILSLGSQSRVEAEAEAVIARMEGGFRVLDSIAQTAPLLGLFGTVLGMIDAFRALQEAGSAVDPSLLAGGIWVALLTTAAGLGVAMPTALALTWLESRVAAERTLAGRAIEARFSPLRGDAEGASPMAQPDGATRPVARTVGRPVGTLAG